MRAPGTIVVGTRTGIVAVKSDSQPRASTWCARAFECPDCPRGARMNSSGRGLRVLRTIRVNSGSNESSARTGVMGTRKARKLLGLEGNKEFWWRQVGHFTPFATTTNSLTKTHLFPFLSPSLLSLSSPTISLPVFSLQRSSSSNKEGRNLFRRLQLRD